MKRAVFVLLIAALFSPARADDFSAGVASLAHDDTTAGYSRLEQGFAREADPRKKGRIAALLAVAAPERIKGSRERYARAALAAPIELAVADRQRLLRILGDTLFDQAELAGAEIAYRQASRLAGGSEDERDYAVYKLGWVYLNLDRANEAYLLWDDWLARRRATSLRKLVVKDAGRAWSEALFSAQRGKIPSLAPRIGADENATLFEGVWAGIRRQDKPDLLLLSSALEGSPLSAALSAYLTARSDLFTGAPCAALPFLGRGGTASEGARTLLMDCARLGAQDVKLARQLVPLLDGFKLEGLNRWTKARVLHLAGRDELACPELSFLGQEELRSPEGLARFPAIAADWLEACRATQRPESMALLRALFDAPSVPQAAQADRATWNKIWVALRADAALSKPAAQRLLETAPLWKTSDAPALFLEKASDSSVADALFAAFAPKPVDSRYASYFARRVQTALKQKNVEAAFADLKAYAPLETAKEPWMLRLWTAVSLTAPGKVDPKALAARYVALSSLETQDRRSLAVLFVSSGDWRGIWDNWTRLEPLILADPALRKTLATHTLESLATLAPAFRGEPRDEHKVYFAALADLVDGKPGARLPKLAPRLVRGTPLATDAAALAAIRSLESHYDGLKLKVSSSLQNVLARKIAALKARMQGARRRRWSSEALLAAADRSIAKMAASLADAISSLDVQDAGARQQLQALSDAIRGWRVVDVASSTEHT